MGGRPNFGLLFQGQDNFDPFQAVRADQNNTQLALQAANMMMNQEQAQMSSLLGRSQQRAAQEARAMQQKQVSKAMAERAKEREQNKIMTQSRMDQQLYLAQKEQEQAALQADLSRRAQIQQEQLRAQNAKDNVMLQGQINSDLQERRIAAGIEEQRMKLEAAGKAKARNPELDAAINQALKNQDYDQLNQLVGPEQALKLRKAQQGVIQKSAGDAKYINNSVTVMNSTNQLETMYKNGEFTAKDLAVLKYAPGVVADFTLTPKQRQLRAIIEAAADSYGRIQSGGAINKEEEARFMQLLPSAGDDEQTVLFKLRNLRQIARRGLESKGMSQEQINKLINRNSQEQQNSGQQIRQRQQQINSRLSTIEEEMRRRGLSAGAPQ